MRAAQSGWKSTIGIGIAVGIDIDPDTDIDSDCVYLLNHDKA